MSSTKKMAVRMAIYLVLVGYLLLDLFVFQGPVQKKLSGRDEASPAAIAAAKAEGIVARVYGQPVYGTQVAERVKEYLWRRGRVPADASEPELELIRQVVLRDLIDERLVKVQIKVSATDEFPIPEAEIDAAVANFQARYSDPPALQSALTRQGWEGQKELRYRIAARLQQEKFFQKMIGEKATVTPEEARDWYDTHQETLALPERRRVRHVFIAALDHTEDEAKNLIETARKQVVDEKKPFPEVARSLSEDLRSRENGGDLGLFDRDELPADFTKPVFSLPLNQPRVLRTKLGWHLLEVTEILPPRPRPFEEVQKEITAALAIQKRENLIEGFRQLLRHWAGDKVQVFR